MKDRKLLLLLALIVAFSALRLQAQTATTTLVTDPESGLEYLDDGDGKLYIYVGGNAMSSLPTINGVSSHKYFIPDDNLRPALRDAFNSSNAKFYKSALDAVTVIGGSSTTLRNQVENYKGLEYFRNLTTLTVKSEGVSSITLDLSKNTKLSSLSFTNNGEYQKLSYLDISNTKLTSVIIPSGGQVISQPSSVITPTLRLPQSHP